MDERFAFTNEQWREYQRTPECGYSHRHHIESVVNRWLAEHDRAVAANAWDECDRRHLEYEHSVRSAPPSNPYRITEENN